MSLGSGCTPAWVIEKRIAREKDARILYGSSVLVTGIPGPHARARMAGVAAERDLISRVARHDNVPPRDVEDRVRKL